MNALTIYGGMTVRLEPTETNPKLQQYVQTYGTLLKWRTKEDGEEEGYVQFGTDCHWVDFANLEG